jgi:hypothetical protein
MQRRLRSSGIDGPTQSLSVQRDRFASQATGQFRSPALQAVVELSRIQSGEDSSESVVRWDAVGKRNVPSQPRELGLSESLDICPGIGVADSGAKRNEDHFDQFVVRSTQDSSIGQIFKVIVNFTNEFGFQSVGSKQKTVLFKNSLLGDCLLLLNANTWPTAHVNVGRLPWQ